jgi:hypothetical protein
MFMFLSVFVNFQPENSRHRTVILATRVGSGCFDYGQWFSFEWTPRIYLMSAGAFIWLLSLLLTPLAVSDKHSLAGLDPEWSHDGLVSLGPIPSINDIDVRLIRRPARQVTAIQYSTTTRALTGPRTL